ncbi:MAG: PilW family protein [Candidatus Paceibacterales bacterium]
MENRGFTLIEFLLYIGILVMVLVLTGGFLWDIIFGNIKETSYQEVQQNSRFVLVKITQEIKKATGINSPTPGTASTTLSLAMAATSTDPTVFDLVNEKLRITQSTSSPYEMTSNQVIVTNLQFTNLSYPDTPGTIRIEMTIDHINPGSRSEYEASASFKSTVSLVEGGAAP